MQDEPKHVITIKEMRTKLGKEYADVSDQEVEEVIVLAELMAEIVIKEIKQELLVPNSP